MKALILCAGLGTRLQPITNTIPKPLVPINGTPLLEYHIRSLTKYGITDVLINTHHLPEQIEDFVKNASGKYKDIRIKTTYEEVLLGSAGTLKENAYFFAEDENFLVIYGDNLTNIDYGKLIATHERTHGLVTIASYTEEFPESKGVIGFDENDLIYTFIEKPKPEQVISKQANAGMYVINKKIFDYLDNFEKIPLDFGFDIFPYLLEKKEKMHIYKMTEVLLDIGTLESYTKFKDIQLDF